jgi:hypothetical protein
MTGRYRDGADADMSETTDDDQALERRNWNRLTAAVAVVVLTVLGMMAVQRVRRFLNSVARSHAAVRRQDSAVGFPD